MSPIEFEGQTELLAPPAGMPHGSCGALPIARFPEPPSMSSLSSFWKPTQEEIIAILEGACIRLDVYGFTHPPVAVAVERVTEMP